MNEQITPPGRRLSLSTHLWLAALAAVAGLAAVYATLALTDNASPTSGSGEMSKFVYATPPAELPDVSFVDAEGKPRALADWKGKVVLLNLWATWCAPCRKEMPSLNRLQKALGSDKFEVVALSIDKTGIDVARKFLTDTKSDALRLYVDPTTKAGTALNIAGLPVTLLIGAGGHEIGRLTGPAEWDSAEAKQLIQSAITN